MSTCLATRAGFLAGSAPSPSKARSGCAPLQPAPPSSAVSEVQLSDLLLLDGKFGAHLELLLLHAVAQKHCLFGNLPQLSEVPLQVFFLESILQPPAP